jgi:hypothetical protein
MRDKPGASSPDHPNLVAGRAALPRPLADLAAFEPTTPIASARPGITVDET